MIKLVKPIQAIIQELDRHKNEENKEEVETAVAVLNEEVRVRMKEVMEISYAISSLKERIINSSVLKLLSLNDAKQFDQILNILTDNK